MARKTITVNCISYSFIFQTFISSDKTNVPDYLLKL